MHFSYIYIYTIGTVYLYRYIRYLPFLTKFKEFSSRTVYNMKDTITFLNVFIPGFASRVFASRHLSMESSRISSRQMIGQPLNAKRSFCAISLSVFTLIPFPFPLRKTANVF